MNSCIEIWEDTYVCKWPMQALPSAVLPLGLCPSNRIPAPKSNASWLSTQRHYPLTDIYRERTYCIEYINMYMSILTHMCIPTGMYYMHTQMLSTCIHISVSMHRYVSTYIYKYRCAWIETLMPRRAQSRPWH